MSTGVQTESHPHAPVGTTGSKKDERPCLWVSHQGPDSEVLFAPCLSGLAESLSPRSRVAQDTGLGRSWGQPRGLDWLAGHAHQTRGQNPSPPRARKTYFHRKQRARKQAEMGARPAETPTAPSLGMDSSKEPITPRTALPKCLQSREPTCAGPDGQRVDAGPGEPPEIVLYPWPQLSRALTAWRPRSPWDVDPGHRGRGHLARKQRARSRLEARVASTNKEAGWAEGQGSSAVSPGRRQPGNAAENRHEEVVSRGHGAHPDPHRRCLQNDGDRGERTRAPLGWALGT